MDLSNLPEEIGCWKRDRVLGAGGFGFVILWRKKDTNETIALKQCRWGHDSMMTPKHRSGWKLEVDMMSRLNHPNIVTAFSVPPELDVPATELPLLAMEYCSGGDLRKLLNKPENCCGLKEKHARLLLRHVSSAVNYLHSKRIIHRDLKPENIVIQDSNGSMVFKLIDLGYAKELDQGSLCTSFVGTLQYLAPELFMSQKYSGTVDYWSLGLVTHEIITGLRPFLPDKSPAEWIPIIKQKKSSQIRAYLDDDKNIVFSSEISSHHHICSIFKEDIESWLQMMLEYDPKKRGRCNGTSAFVHLEKILDKKVIYIFCVNTFKMLSFSADEIISLDDLKKVIELKTGIPVNEQEILLPKGNLPNPDKGISQFLSNSENDVGAFLFRKSEIVMNSWPNTQIPPAVETMMRSPRQEVKYMDQRTTWIYAVYLSHQEYFLVGKLIQAFRTSLMHLLSRTSHSHKSTSQMIAEMNKLTAKSTFLKSSLEQDIHSYESQAESGGFTSQNMFDGWKSSYENLKKMDILKHKVTTLEGQSSTIDSETVELQRTTYARSRQANPLEDTHNKILDAYCELKKRSKEQRHIPHDNTDIVRLLCSCLQQSRSSTQDIMLLIRHANKIKQSIEEVSPQIMNLIQEIEVWDSQICSWQFKRQREMWKVVDALTDKIHCLERTQSPLLLSSSPQASAAARHSANLSHPVFPRHNMDGNLKRNQDPSFPSVLRNMSSPIIPVPPMKNKIEPLSSGSTYLNDNFDKSWLPTSIQSIGMTSLSSLVERTVEDTNRIKQENEDLVVCFQQMMDTLKCDQQAQVSEENGDKTCTVKKNKERNL